MSTFLKYLVLLAVSLTAHGQTSRFISIGQLKASTDKERIKSAIHLEDLSPDFWQKLGMAPELRADLEKRRLTASAQGYYVYPADKNFGKYLAISSATVTAFQDGKRRTEIAGSDRISDEIRTLIAQADIGTDLVIALQFTDRNESGKEGGVANLIEGRVNIHVVPENEAEFPGGNNAFTAYLFKHIVSQFGEGKERSAVSRSLVTFTVNEDGSIQGVKMSVSSGDKKTDKYIIDAMTKMPYWKPAKENNKAVEQTITTPFNADGC